MKLSVITPVLNEEFFLPLYLEAVLEYADEVLFLDGGSKDDSLKIIRHFQTISNKRIHYWQIPQSGKPYTDDWEEGKRRNFLINQAKGEWILALDTDEFLSENAIRLLPEILADSKDILLYGFTFIPFWQDVHHVRINVPNDPHWEGVIYRLIKRETASYSAQGNHCLILCNNRYGVFCQQKKMIEEIKLFHYHYALGTLCKTNDNRRGDLGFTSENNKIDWEYQPEDYQIKTRKFKGKHPAVIERYLKGW